MQDPNTMHDLIVERLIEAPVGAVWRAYTDHLGEWFCPPPWRAEVVALDLRAGGRSAVTMYGPDGEVMANEGVYLEVVPERRIVFTDAFTEGWKPAGPFIVGMFELEPEGARTRYRGTARHWTAEAMERHQAMGFTDGWSKVAEQWEKVAQRIAAQ